MNSLLVRPTASSRQLVAHILDEPALVAEVRALPPRALAKLIDHVGLEDAGEIVQLATAEQIERVFDEDLWKSDAPGEDESFDASRFVVWLEILLEAGDRAAGRRLAELPEDVLTLAFQRLVVVVDVDELAAEVAERDEDEGDAIEKALEGALSHEIGSFMIIGRQHDGWDAIVNALVALDEEDHSACTRLLERCAAMSTRESEEHGGLYDLLTAEEMLEADAAGARGDRRAGEGFVAPSDARAFLRHAREGSFEDILKEPRDFLTRAWFRELDRRPPPPEPAAPNLLGLLESAGVMREAGAEVSPARSRPALGAARNGRKTTPRGQAQKKPRALTAGVETAAERVRPDDDAASGLALRSALERLAALDPRAHAERLEELAFLVNVLVAGATFHGRAFRPGEAAEAAVTVANAGLEHLAKLTAREAGDIVAKEGVVAAFRAGVKVGALDVLAR
jgi:hypothetical protein